jgi:two-component SAPR family response regulator
VSERFTVRLLGGFDCDRDKQRLDLPPSCQRVVALAALKLRPLHRTWMCATLWPYSPPSKAVARLRSTLWRLRPLGADALLRVDSKYVSLAPGVSVDWHRAVQLIERLLSRSGPASSDPELVAELLPLLRAGELLDGWTEQWNANDRSRYRAMRAAALDMPTRRPSERAGHPRGDWENCSQFISDPTEWS